MATFASVDTSGSPQTYQLPSAPAAGALYVVADVNGNATTNAITVTTTGGQTINGRSSELIHRNYGTLELVSTGAGWMVVGRDPDVVTDTCQGFGTSNYYAGAAGTCQGSTTMTVVVVAEATTVRSGGAREIVSCSDENIGGGWGVGCDDNRVKLWWTLSDGTKIQNFVNGGWDVGPDSNGFKDGRILIFHARATAGRWQLYFFGEQLLDLGVASFLAEPTAGLTLGKNAKQASRGWNGGIIGAGYHGSVAWTEAQIREHVVDVMAARDMVTGSGGLQNMWSFRGYGSAPTTLPDLIGSVNLTKTGTLTVRTRTFDTVSG